MRNWVPLSSRRDEEYFYMGVKLSKSDLRKTTPGGEYHFPASITGITPDEEVFFLSLKCTLKDIREMPELKEYLESEARKDNSPQELHILKGIGLTSEDQQCERIRDRIMHKVVKILLPNTTKEKYKKARGRTQAGPMTFVKQK